MADGPRVTVVIPTYNRAPLLVEAIESVLRQTYRDLEVVVCDDGSGDGTAARVEVLGARVRYVALPHSGRPGAPRNRGIEVARGELIAFLDDDDLWEPDKLARQVELMDRDGLNLVYTDRLLRFDDGSTSELVVSPAPASPDRLLDLVLAGHFPSVCSMLVQRTLLQEIDAFDETLVTGEDLDLWLRIAPIARAAKVPEPLLVVRRRPGSLSDLSGSATYRNAIRVLERALATHDLLPAQRQSCRATLGRLNSKLAAMSSGREAMRAALHAVRYSPANRASWASLTKSFRGEASARRTA
jgi:glycosyltransferase involved in cell wall biosynthesis